VNTHGILLISCLAGTLAAQSPPAAPATNAPPGAPEQPPTLEQLEQSYAADKITARQFQWYLRRYKALYVKSTNAPASPAPPAPRPAASAPEIKSAPPVAPQVQPAAVAVSNQPPSPARPPATNAPSPPPAALPPVPAAPTVLSSKLPEQTLTNSPATNSAAKASSPASAEENDPAIREVEVKIDKLLKLKEARDQAAKLETLLATNTPAKLKTKRQRLNELIRLHVNGVLTEPEYKTKRDAIVAEPEN
jgi:hypothetical protein